MENLWKGAGFTNSKVVSDKVMDSSTRNLNISLSGNSSKAGIGLASKSKASINPTTDSDDNSRAKGISDSYGMNIAAGASGDKSTGYPYQGEGQDTLKGAQGN